MKLALLLVPVLAFTAFAGAQTAPPQQQVEATADSVTRVGNIVQLRGNVQIRREGSLVTADEADVTTSADAAAPDGIELRGNVRLTSANPIGLAIKRR
jgi:lipopolysaccharide assembly outer membrane protein LptD (OstA)